MNKNTREEVVFRGWLGYIAFMRNVKTYKCNLKEMKMISNYIYSAHVVYGAHGYANTTLDPEKWFDMVGKSG